MPILSLKNITYAVSEFPLLDAVNLEVEPGERIALIGRNGEGKSTLLKIISQELVPEGGEVQKPSYLKVSRLAQELPPLEKTTVYEAVAHGLADLSNMLVQYHHLIAENNYEDPKWLNDLHVLQQKIEQQGGWQIQQRVDRIVQALSLPADMFLSDLSGGWRRRVALAQALVQEPDILLLDEPTNHLDLAAIQWLEDFLLNYPKTLIFITHDRALLRKIATRIVELDRGKLTSYPSDYDKYLERKAQALADEERHNALFDKKLSEEEQWLRQGIKARRTRNEGRVRALKALREERKLRRVRQEKPAFEVNDPQTKGKMAIQAIDVSFAYDPAKPIIKDFSFNIQRGDKIAIIGPNGTGKTTLIKLLCGLLTPTAGKIVPSPANQIAFFDQNRAQLDPNDTVMGNVVEGSDYIEIQDKKKHIIGYLGDFLFSPAKCRSLARVLSGGEQNRLLLAKLFSKPANILVLDEPTNDLDIETLDVLENLLLNYPGTILIISHDREFIDNIATHCLAFEGEGKISVNVGGYSDWLERQVPVTTKNKTPAVEKETKKAAPTVKAQKLSFNEQRELTQLPAKIEQLETKINDIQMILADPQFYSKDKDIIEQTKKSLQELEKELASTYQKWEDLESRQ